jgi:DNA-binding NarL/FixJ family response regulator
MTTVLLAAPQSDVRAALRLLLLDLDMGVVGEAADWSTTLALASETWPDMLLVDWELVPRLRQYPVPTAGSLPGRRRHSSHQPAGRSAAGGSFRRRRRLY